MPFVRMSSKRVEDSMMGGLISRGLAFLVACFLLSTVTGTATAAPLAVRGIHLLAPRQSDVPLFVRFISEALPKEGVNTLVLEINYRYHSSIRPEVAERDALSRADLQVIGAACKTARVRLIPLIDLLGHQSWGSQQRALLRAHPELTEPSEKYPCAEGICNSSYCPLHPDTHAIVFDLIDEIMDACGADAFHAGLDEVVVLGEDACPRCRGISRAQLFADEVAAIHNHLAKSNRQMWMWGDRLLDGPTTGLGKWGGSENGTADAIRMISKDIVICDWHYDVAVPSAAHFAVEGFDVVSSPWRKPGVALAQLDLIQSAREHSPPVLGQRMKGVLQTVWSDAGGFIGAYFGEAATDLRTAEAVVCFKTLFEEIRRRGLR